MLTIDLNCDIGESTSRWPYNIQNDIALLPYVSSINVACGFHAGDPDTASELIKAACAYDISVGAHPSFPDRDHFGRNEMNLDEKELYRIVYKQVEFIGNIALSAGRRMNHVKPHGALYNMAAKDHRMAFVICSAIHAYNEELVVYGLSRSMLIDAAETLGLKTCSEVFADRTYQSDGSLSMRNSASAFVKDSEEAAKRVMEMIETGYTVSVDGTRIMVKPETVCIHSDGEDPPGFAKIISETLKKKDITIGHP